MPYECWRHLPSSSDGPDNNYWSTIAIFVHRQHCCHSLKGDYSVAHIFNCPHPRMTVWVLLTHLFLLYSCHCNMWAPKWPSLLLLLINWVTEWLVCWRNYEDMFRYNGGVWQTDRRTDRHNSYIIIACEHCVTQFLYEYRIARLSFVVDLIEVFVYRK